LLHTDCVNSKYFRQILLELSGSISEISINIKGYKYGLIFACQNSWSITNREVRVENHEGSLNVTKRSGTKKEEEMKKLLLAAVIVTCLAFQAHASIITYNDRGLFPDNNSVGWAQLGAVESAVTSGTVANAANFGTVVTVSSGDGSALKRHTQVFYSWVGNFAAGDELIAHTENRYTTLIFDFSTNISGGGAQIQTALYGSFTGHLYAYDAGLNLLGTYNLAGNSNDHADNSAIFMGIYSTENDIRRLVFSADGTGGLGLAINQLEFYQAVPIPGALWLLGSGLIGLVGMRRFRK
jgi:hypothetical protein